MTATTPTSRTHSEHVFTPNGARYLCMPSDLITDAGYTWSTCTVTEGQSEQASWEMVYGGDVRWFVIDSEVAGPERWSIRAVDDNWKVRREAFTGQSRHP